MNEIAVRLELDEIELPVGPGSIVKIRVTSGAEEFLGPGGFGAGFTLKVNDETWRTVLVGAEIRQPDGEILATFQVEGRYQ